MRSVLLLLTACTALHATPVATATCTLDSEIQTMTSATLAFCSLSYPVPGSWFIQADAAVQRSFGADGSVQYLSVDAEGGALVPDTPPPASAFGSATDMEYFRSSGPPRPGLIAFVERGYGNGGNSVSIGDGVNEYSLACDSFSCSYNGSGPPVDGGLVQPSLVPFELGTLFQVSLSAVADGGCTLSSGCSQEGASVEFLQLFEVDGTTPVSYSLVAVPEPGAGALILLGVTAAIWMYRKPFERNNVEDSGDDSDSSVAKWGAIFSRKSKRPLA